MDLTTFVNWTDLASFAAVTALVVVIVQFLKLPIDHVKKVPTRFVVWVISFVILTVAKLFAGQIGGDNWYQELSLCVLNSIFIALSAMKSYEVTVDRINKVLQTGIDTEE
jgi:F0F1-type ATP synthase membrane subunit a